MNRRLHTSMMALIVLAVLAVSTSLSAYGRDADGSRMQARKHTLGSTVSGRLSPPNDSVDWLYVRLKDSARIQVLVSNTPETGKVRVQLTNAVGKSLASKSTTKGKLKVSKRVDPGLYYIAVSANAPTKYKITIR